MGYDGIRELVQGGTIDAELGGLLALLLGARIPAVVIATPAAAATALADALADLLPGDVRVAEVATDDDFAWLPEAVELGWRRERPSDRRGAAGERRVAPSDGVLLVRGLGSMGGEGVAGERARLVVRALSLGYGMIATMDGAGLEDALGRLADPAAGTDEDERSRLGVVLAVGDGSGTQRVTAAHYVRPTALDSHGHVQRLPPAVLATWNPAAGRWDHFAWGLAAELAGRLGMRPIELEREQARRAAELA